MSVMARTRVKICGICRPQDAKTAVMAGADAIGMVFQTGARRRVTIKQAREILAVLPSAVSSIGLFVDADVAKIRKIASALSLSAVQLHGSESPATVAKLKPIPVIKRLDTKDLGRWRRRRLPNLIGILLDSPAGGGSGVTNDFAAIRKLQKSGAFDGLPPLIVAGGLTAKNVAGVVKLLQPFAVDVSSGVESVVRQKSPAKIKAFLRAVRHADKRSR